MKRFGKYLLVRKIASGGMADVFKAKALGIRGFTKTLAIKRIHPHLTEDARFIRMFTDEAKIAAALVHPNIVQIYDLGEEDGVPFIAMEYVPGRDLLEVLRRCLDRERRFPVALACRVVVEVCEGLEQAHGFRGLDGLPQEIVHRDVTPRNILIGWGGAIKLTDFGVARANRREEETEAGLIKGKVRYLSPEAASGAEVDRRTDIFSLGAVFMEMLNMRPLFEQHNELEVLLAISEGKIDPAKFENVPEHLAAVCRRALAADKDERYPTAQEMKQDLLKAARQELGQVRPEQVISAMRFLFETEIDEEREADRETEERLAEQARKTSRPDAPAPAADTAPVERPAPPPFPIDAYEEEVIPLAAVEAIPLDTEVPDEGSLDLSLEILPPISASEASGSQVSRWDEIEVPESATPAPPPTDAEPQVEYANDPETADFADVQVTGAVPRPAIPDIHDVPTPPGGTTSLGVPPPEQPDDAPPGATAAAGPATAEAPAADSTEPADEAEAAGEVRPIPPASEVSPHATAPQPLGEEDTPAFEGDLSRTSFIRVLYRLGEEGATGRLDVRRDPVQKAVFFTEGEPLFATSNVESELFGEHLIARGMVQREDIDRALAEAAVKHQRLTEVLLALGLLQPHDLFQLLAEQVRDKILDLFTWVSGRYAFYPGATPPDQGFPLGLTVYGLILEGMRENVPQVVTRRALKPHLTKPLERTGGAVPAALQLTGKEQRILRLIEKDQVTLEQLALSSGDEDLAYRVVYMLKEVGRLSFVG